MKKLIQSNKDTARSRRRASFTGFPMMLLGLSLSFLDIRSAIACDEICEAYPTFNTGFGYLSLVNKTTGISNAAFGYATLTDNTTGSDNTAVGIGALALPESSSGNTAVGSDCLAMNTGSFNTAVGEKVMWQNDAEVTTGSYNTAVGGEALAMNNGSFNAAFGYLALAGGIYANENNHGSNNTGIGSFALYYDSGSFNTALGDGALQYNSSGQSNTASGVQAMYGDSTNLSSGSNNTATGYQALYKDTTGGSNTATGIYSLYFNVSGNYNTATGRGALYKNTASNNTATGYQSLNLNTNGHDNVAFGMRALQNNTGGYSNTALGSYALQTNISGYTNIAVGLLAGYYITGNNNIDIGNQGVTGESGTIRIGTSGSQTNTYIAGVSGATVPGGVGVIVDSSGHLGTTTSSARFKENIRPMNKASEAILSLEPVTFRYKKELDQKGIPQFGLVAEEVEKVDHDLVVRDDQGKPYSVRYEAVNAMLLNEFLKEHRTVQQQQKEIEALRAELKEQRALIQQVNDKIELSKSAPQIVSTKQ